MSDASTTLGLPEAARRLGVSVRVLRGAIRAGRLQAPPHMTATIGLSAEWLADAEAAVAAKPGLFRQTFPQKVPPFARFEGTSAWHKYGRRARAYAQFRAQAASSAQSASASGQ